MDSKQPHAGGGSSSTGTLPPPAYSAAGAAAASSSTPTGKAQYAQPEFEAELTSAFNQTAFVDTAPAFAAASSSSQAPYLPPPPPSASQHQSSAFSAPSPSPRAVAFSSAPVPAPARSETLAPDDSISMAGYRPQPSQHQLNSELRHSDATLAASSPGEDEYPARKDFAYNDPYAPRAQPYGNQYDDDDDDDDYHAGKAHAYGYGSAADIYARQHGHHPSTSSANLPLNQHGASMGYAEDEDDEARQLKSGALYGGAGAGAAAAPGLFSNQLQYDPSGQPLDPSRGNGFTREGDPGQPGSGGLLGKFGRKSAGGMSDMSKVEQQVERRRAGVFRQRYGVLAILLGIVYIIVFIVELIRSNALTGQAFQTRPRFQPMIGPPFEFFIAFPLGARFVPCMRKVPTTPTTMLLPCLNATTLSAAELSASGGGATCPIWELCGLQGPDGPFQGHRFVTAMFIHAGVIHLLFNILAQFTLVVQVEKILGSLAFAVVYFAGGIGGNLLGGNFGLMSPALGASGAVYTAVGVEMTDLILNWHWEVRRKTRLTVSVLFAVLGLGLGLLPGLDNFSHIGGFICGVLGGLAFGPSIHPSTKHRISVWIVRLVALALMVGFLAGLAANFYSSEDPAQACRWCRYLSCLPVFAQCQNDGLQTTTITTNSGS